jgi:hypothetical protein
MKQEWGQESGGRGGRVGRVGRGGRGGRGLSMCEKGPMKEDSHRHG